MECVRCGKPTEDSGQRLCPACLLQEQELTELRSHDLAGGTTSGCATWLILAIAAVSAAAAVTSYWV